MSTIQPRLKPLHLSKEGFNEDSSEAVRKMVDRPGWLPAINMLLTSGEVRVIRRNCLGEQRTKSDSSLPTSQLLR